MKVWIVCCGETVKPLPKRCTGADFEAALAAQTESEIVPYTGKPLDASGRIVYIAPGRRARETAEQVYPGAEIRVEPLMEPIPQRAWRDTEAEHPLWLWQRMAERQARIGDPRQPESRKASIKRAEEFIVLLEERDEDCILVMDSSFLAVLLDRFRLHSCSIARSGIIRIRPMERFLITRRDTHCGGCQHNCLLTNPGCGIGADKARRLNEGYRA